MAEVDTQAVAATEAAPAAEPIAASDVASDVVPAVTTAAPPAQAAQAEPARAVEAPAAEPAPAVAVAAAPLPAAAPFTLPAADLRALADSVGLEWVNSDAEKVRATQEAMARQPKPIHVPREPRPQPPVDTGPLVLVETRKDLSQMKLPFEQQTPAP